MTRRGTWRSWSKRFECFSSFLKYLFRHKLASFCCFSQQFFTLYCLWVIIPFSKQNQTKTEPEVCVNWPILKNKIEKETYSWDFCKIPFQLNCLFVEINVQRLLIKENLKPKRMYLVAILFFFIPGERSCSSSPYPKSQMVCYPNLKQWK